MQTSPPAKPPPLAPPASEPTPSEDDSGAAAPERPPADRAERLAEALRDNLRRRKTQARARAGEAEPDRNS